MSDTPANEKPAEHGRQISGTQLMALAIVIAGLLVSVTVFLSVNQVGDRITAAMVNNPAPDNSNPDVEADVQPSNPAPPTQPNAAALPTITTAIDIQGENVKGNANAEVTIIEFSEFLCPYCARAATTVDQLEQSYGNDVKFVHKNFIVHGAQAMPPSVAQECAELQGKGWEMHAKIFANQGSISTDNLKQWASDLGLDTAKFNACLDGNQTLTHVNEEAQLGRKLGVSGTPTFFFLVPANHITTDELDTLKALEEGMTNGNEKYFQVFKTSDGSYALMLVGAQPYDTFAQILDIARN